MGVSSAKGSAAVLARGEKTLVIPSSIKPGSGWSGWFCKLGRGSESMKHDMYSVLSMMQLSVNMWDKRVRLRWVCSAGRAGAFGCGAGAGNAMNS